MPDFMDSVQALVLLEIEAQVQAQTAPRPVGMPYCGHPECDEPISVQRQALGAQLCLEHQREHEAKARRRGHRWAA